jgi:hypothetical protein
VKPCARLEAVPLASSLAAVFREDVLKGVKVVEERFAGSSAEGDRSRSAG